MHRMMGMILARIVTTKNIATAIMTIYSIYIYIYTYVNRMIPVPDVTNSIPEHLAFVSSSVSMAATEVRLIFLEMGT